MDIATLIGFLGTFGLILGSIITGAGLGAFLDVPSLMIVVAGTLTTALIQYPLGTALSAVKVVMNTIKVKDFKIPDVNLKLTEFAGAARKDGILALEKEIEAVDDDFLKRGLQLLVDGIEPDIIEDMLYAEVDAMGSRHKSGADFFRSLAAISPALGLIGTLIGLVQMLQAMDDPSAIGPAMAVAMLTTFYGALLANVIFTPLAGKLETRHKEEELSRTCIIKGLMGIANGLNPRVLVQQLDGELAPALRSDQKAA